LASDILTLWGMADLGTPQTAPYVLQMSFDKNAPRQQFGNGGFGIATRDSNGNWVNAASMTSAGTTQFAKGPWKSNYPVGTYGVSRGEQNRTVFVVSKTGQLRCAEGVWECPKGQSWRRPERSGGRRNDWPLRLRGSSLPS
jgi:hypothetical protein